MIEAMASDFLDQYVRPILGHVSKRTTEMYLVWLRTAVGADRISLQRSISLDALEEEAGDEQVQKI